MAGMYFAGGALRFRTDDDEDESRRLRDALAQLLQVNQLALLIGAGASFHLGAPAIRAVAVDDLSTMSSQAGTDLSDNQLDVLRALLGDAGDLEDLLGQLSIAMMFASAFGLDTLNLAGSTTTADELKELFGAVNVALAQACALPRGDVEPPHDSDPWYTHRELFRRILGARRPDAPRVRVFTTNYDTVIEQALDDAGIYYVDGFVGGLRRSLNLASYSNDIFSPRGTGRASLLRVRDLLQLYKLHGSLTWRAVPSLAGMGTTAIVQAPGAPEHGELAVLYPTPSKEADVLGFPYADLLRELGTTLVAPECALIVVGYGFADEHINRLVYQALAANSTLQVLIVDPYGVVEDLAADDPVFRDSAIGRVARVADARISVFTGSDAEFASFVALLPDVGEGQSALGAEARDVLADAFDLESE